MYPDDFYYINLWKNLYDEHFIPRNRTKPPQTMGTILRRLIEELESVANDLDKKDDIEADITLRFNNKIYSIEIKSVAQATPDESEDEDNTTDLSNDDSSTGE